MSELFGRSEPRVGDLSHHDAGPVGGESLATVIRMRRECRGTSRAVRPTSRSRGSACCVGLVPGVGASPEAGDDAVRLVLAESDPESVIWLLSRAVSYMDEQGFPTSCREPEPSSAALARRQPAAARGPSGRSAARSRSLPSSRSSRWSRATPRARWPSSPTLGTCSATPEASGSRSSRPGSARARRAPNGASATSVRRSYAALANGVCARRDRDLDRRRGPPSSPRPDRAERRLGLRRRRTSASR
jgi:hypothetical protein